MPSPVTKSVLVVTDDELWSLAVWREARGESDEAKLAVAYVIQNRANDKKHRWPSTIRGVILQPKQFSSFTPGDQNYEKYPLKGQKSWADSQAAVEKVKAGAEDPTKGANLYHSLSIGSVWPRWAEPELLTAKIGPFRFYKS